MHASSNIPNYSKSQMSLNILNRRSSEKFRFLLTVVSSSHVKFNADSADISCDGLKEVGKDPGQMTVSLLAIEKVQLAGHRERESAPVPPEMP